MGDNTIKMRDENGKLHDMPLDALTAPEQPEPPPEGMVRMLDERGQERLVALDAMTPEPVRAPATADPGFLEPGGTGYATVRGAQRGLLGDTLNAQIGAAGQVAGEYGQRGLAALGIGDAPPERTFDEYYQSQMMGDALSDQHSPRATAWAKAAGQAPAAILAPEVKAAQGAGLLGRAAATGKNVALDAAMGGAYAGSESDAQDPMNRAQDVLEGAGISGGVRGAMGAGGELVRGVVGAAKQIPRQFAKATAAMEGPEAARIADEMTANTPAGAQRRALALSGDEVVEEMAPRVYDNLARQQDVYTKVHEQTGVRMKAGPIARHLEESGLAETGGLMDDMANIRQSLTDVMNAPGKGLDVAPGPGRNAKGALATGMETARRNMARIGESSPEASAEMFVIFDQLKRDIGKAAKKAAAGGSNADEPFADALWDQYESMRRYLEDSARWGEGPSQLQRRVNKAWVEYIDHAPGMDRYLMESQRLSPKRAPNMVDRVQRPDPTQVTGALRGAGTFDTQHQELALREGSAALGRLTDVLADAYELGADVQTMARGSVDDAAEISGALTESAAARGASGEMQQLREVGGSRFRIGPSPGEIATGMGMAERRMSSPAVSSTMSSAGEAARLVPRAMGLAAAGDSAYSTSDVVQQLARSNPAALGPHGPDLARAAQEGNFEVVHAIKMQSSQDYQDRLAGLEADHFEEN